MASPRCVVSTGDDFCKSIRECSAGEVRASGRRGADAEYNFFHEAQFSPDASCIVTRNEDHILRTFVLPSEIDENEPDSLPWKPHALFRSPSNIQSFTIHPSFDLDDPATATVLCASAGIPIQLRNSLDYGPLVATYPFVNEATERHLNARALLINPDATHFVAGADGFVSVFDLSRDGCGPVVTHKLSLNRNMAKTMRHWQFTRAPVTALSMSGNILAMGNAAREIALYDNHGLGQCDAIFSIEVSSGTVSASGSGVSMLKWSPCGRYLFVAERESDSIAIFDIRGSGRIMTTLEGRRALTPQVLGFDLVVSDMGTDVWAGGFDGVVRTWRNPTASSGDIQPDCSYKMHQAPVSSTAWDRSGTILATCSGNRREISMSSGESEASDSSDGSGELEDLEMDIELDDHDEDRDQDTPRRPDNTLRLWRF